MNALSNLGNTLSNLGRVEEAQAAFFKALAISPNSASIQNNLALAYKQQGRIDEVIVWCRKAVAQQPDYADAWNNLGSFLKGQGRVVEAVQCLHKTAILQPADPQAFSNYLLLLPYDPATTPQKLFDEHVAWSRQFADPLLSQIQPHRNDRTPTRRLRIGYCSPNFRGHALGYYLLPIVRRHDHLQFEVYFYSDVTKPDELTELFRPCAPMYGEIPRHCRMPTWPSLSAAIASTSSSISRCTWRGIGCWSSPANPRPCRRLIWPSPAPAECGRWTI